MLSNQLFGSFLNQNKDIIALDAIKRQMEEKTGFALALDSEAQSMLSYIYQDISKLFTAVISERPALFAKYVAWQRSVLASRAISNSVLSENLNLLKSVIIEHSKSEYLDIINEYFSQAQESLSEQMIMPETFIDHLSEYSKIAEEYLRLILINEQEEAISYIFREIDKGLELKDVYLEVIQPVQYEIGRLWQLNKISVAKEHYATDTTRLLINKLFNYIKQIPKNNKTVLTTCIGNEMHDVGIRIVTDYLAINGYRTHYLGANVPIKSILSLLDKNDVDILAISATMSNEIYLVKRLIETIRNISQNKVKIIVGGNVFNQNKELYEYVGADAFGKNAVDALSVVNSLAG